MCAIFPSNTLQLLIDIIRKEHLYDTNTHNLKEIAKISALESNFFITCQVEAKILPVGQKVLCIDKSQDFMSIKPLKV